MSKLFAFTGRRALCYSRVMGAAAGVGATPGYQREDRVEIPYPFNTLFPQPLPQLTPHDTLLHRKLSLLSNDRLNAKDEFAVRLKRLEADHAKELERVEADHAVELARVKAEQAMELTRVEASHVVVLAAIEANHVEVLEQAKATYAAELKQVVEQANRARQLEKENHSKALEQLRVHHAEVMAQAQANHAKELRLALEQAAANHSRVLRQMQEEHTAFLKEKDVQMVALHREIEILKNAEAESRNLFHKKNAAYNELMVKYDNMMEKLGNTINVTECLDKKLTAARESKLCINCNNSMP